MSFDDLVNNLDVTGALRDATLRREFCIQLVERLALSEAEKGWLEIARKYKTQQATEAELVRARVSAWESLGNRSCDFKDMGVNRTRAVICALYTDAQSEEEYMEKILQIKDFFRDAGGTERGACKSLEAVFLLNNRAE